MNRSNNIEHPFNEWQADSVFKAVHKEIENEITSMPKEYVLGVNSDEYVNYLTARYSIDPVTIYYGSEDVELYKEVKKTHYNEIYRREEPYSEYIFYIRLYFSGESDIFRIHPSQSFIFTISGRVSPIYIESENLLRLQFSIFNQDKSEFKREKASVISNTFMNLDTVNQEVMSFNNLLEQDIRNIFQRIKHGYMKDNAFFESLNVRTAKNSTNTFKVPVIELKVKQPAYESKKQLTPYLENSLYRSILNTIYSAYKKFESLPNNYIGKDEEGLRDSILPILQTFYTTVTATGETFNKLGKTDICIKHTDGTNVFIGECKFWKGEKLFNEAINQLFDRYVTWNDTKVALIFFVQNDNFTDVIQKGQRATKAHPYFIRSVDESHYETRFSYVFRHSEDINRQIKTEIMFFHFNQK